MTPWLLRRGLVLEPPNDCFFPTRTGKIAINLTSNRTVGVCFYQAAQTALTNDPATNDSEGKFRVGHAGHDMGSHGTFRNYLHHVQVTVEGARPGGDRPDSILSEMWRHGDGQATTGL